MLSFENEIEQYNVDILNEMVSLYEQQKKDAFVEIGNLSRKVQQYDQLKSACEQQLAKRRKK